MTIGEFRQNKILANGLRDLLATNTILQAALDVCDGAAPGMNGNNFHGDVFKEPHVAHIQLGLDRGYVLYSRILRTLAVEARPAEQIEPTYEPPKEEEQNA